MVDGVSSVLHKACAVSVADGLSGDSPQHAEVELLSWKQVKDITSDGGVIKKVIKESTEYKTATIESTVKVRCVSISVDLPDYHLSRLPVHGSLPVPAVPQAPVHAAQHLVLHPKPISQSLAAPTNAASHPCQPPNMLHGSHRRMRLSRAGKVLPSLLAAHDAGLHTLCQLPYPCSRMHAKA